MINNAKLDKIMIEMGYREGLSGTAFIRAAAQIYRPGMSITKELYPAVAEIYDSTPPRVERSIRHATEWVFRKGNLALIREYFGGAIDPEKGKPTNADAIARLAYLASE